MGSFVNYAIPGIPYGCDFAIVAVGLVLAYRATGVFNFAFGAQAYVSALVFYLLIQHGVAKWPAALLSVVVLAPALGLAFDRFLFRHIPTTSTIAKAVVSIGLLIAIPNTMEIIFGSTPRLAPPSLWLNPDHVYFHVGSYPVNGNELATTAITVGVVAVLVLFLRYTSLGLEMRAVVESRRLAQLERVNATWTAAAAWALSSLLAGLAGVLLSPLYAQLSSTNFTTLLVAATAAAAFGAFRSMSGALAGGLLLGVAQSVLGGYLPSGSILATDLKPALPFAILAILLLVQPRLRHLGESTDPLSSCDPPPPPPSASVRDPRLERPMRIAWRLLLAGFLVSCMTWVPGNWVFAFATGLTLSTIFLSITLLTGMGGYLSLCQATFAGIGAFTAGQLANHLGLPIGLGTLAGGLLAAAVGMLVALPALRLHGLPLIISTLAFALLADSIVFPNSWAGGGAAGIFVPRPRLGPIAFSSNRTFLLLALAVLGACSALVLLVRKGTVGRFLAAMRGSEAGSASLGISQARSKLTVFALSAFLAGVGGALYGSLQQSISPVDFSYEFSLVFVVVVITTGVRTLEGAVQAGMAFVILQQVLTYLPQRMSGIEPVIFALGAITYAAHPEGVVEYQRTLWMRRVQRLLEAHGRPPPSHEPTDGRRRDDSTGVADIALRAGRDGS